MEWTMNGKKIPATDSIQELASFWDTHDLTEFEGELNEVTEPVFDHDAVFNVRLPPSEAAALKRIADAKGMAEGELVLEWVLERVHGA